MLLGSRPNWTRIFAILKLSAAASRIRSSVVTGLHHYTSSDSPKRVLANENSSSVSHQKGINGDRDSRSKFDRAPWSPRVHSRCTQEESDHDNRTASEPCREARKASHLSQIDVPASGAWGFPYSHP